MRHRCTLLLRFASGVIGEFLFLFLQDLGGSETLMGLTLTVTCLAEVPVFHFQPQLLKLVSVHTMLHIVMWTYMLRMGLYALVSNRALKFQNCEHWGLLLNVVA
jgi:hypothetical protein